MFVVTPYPNIVFALDLTKPGAPMKWTYQAASRAGIAGRRLLRRGQSRRGVTADGKIFFNTLDGNTIALDADDGKLLWKTKLGDINMGETITMAPLVVKGKVLVGDSGGEMGVRGWLAALDASNGKTGLEGVLHRPGQGRADRPGLSSVLPIRQGHGPRRQHLAAGGVEDRRRHGVGLDRLRSRPEPDLSTAPPIPVRGTRSSGPATTNGRPRCSRATPTPAPPNGRCNTTRMTSTTTTASTSRSCST